MSVLRRRDEDRGVRGGGVVAAAVVGRSGAGSSGGCAVVTGASGEVLRPLADGSLVYEAVED